MMAHRRRWTRLPSMTTPERRTGGSLMGWRCHLLVQSSLAMHMLTNVSTKNSIGCP